MQRLTLYWQLTRFNKPIGILLLLWPTLSALWLASNGKPDWQLVIIFTLGTILMRAAGCAVNDYADRGIDSHVKRTSERPLTSGKIAGWEALFLAALLALLAFFLIIPLNGLTKWLSLAAIFVAASYPYFKRFFALPQAYLGIAFGFGILMAYAAVQNHLPASAWLLLLANIFWSLAYDTEYAMVDKEDDAHLGIHTSAITFGRFDVAAVMFCYLAHLVIIMYVGWLYKLGFFFKFGVLLASLCAVYHFYLIRNRSQVGCFTAFQHNNWLGFFVFVGIALDFALTIPIGN
ncbi:MAG: ubiA [Solimicrobium sp.]|jgi:4-hydroxybenzoate polyprenyltransferase|nr:ubiA [Solimicrobium sp.]